ncbi:MAG: polymer-forming cytoskeletal protein [Gammaproteobacteria bacterium]|nr:polymer-forming cytoskeletal protein [Gammaproteobacteria bacterium]MDP2141883.1 polymer-forming cytoskeletal protein [Gammaproteobacteria bacterium]MDP2348166.1 polymer-forming cytoskeletal protein [Gammaproteobacteria bacterium]
MFGSGDKGKPVQGPAHTLISGQTEISGDLRFTGELIVEGRIRGNIYADDESAAVIRVTESGVVEGGIWVPSAVINGLVKGDVHCVKHIELAAKGVIMGDVYYTLIEMVMGSEVNGSLMHIARVQKETERLAATPGNVLSYDAENHEQDSRYGAADSE